MIQAVSGVNRNSGAQTESGREQIQGTRTMDSSVESGCLAQQKILFASVFFITETQAFLIDLRTEKELWNSSPPNLLPSWWSWSLSLKHEMVKGSLCNHVHSYLVFRGLRFYLPSNYFPLILITASWIPFTLYFPKNRDYSTIFMRYK